MENSTIEVVYNHNKKRLTIFEDGCMVGGMTGQTAENAAKKILINNAKVEVKDGNVQIGI
jgi:hypothetical protein